jgi:hypothetical protein
VSTYRYMATSLLGGQTIGDWLPMTPQTFARAINASASFTGALNLTAGTAAENANWRAALRRRSSVLWILQDSVPVWNGLVWDSPHMSVLDGTLPVSATTLDSLFTHRYITDDLTLSGDVFDIFRALVAYAVSKGPGYEVANLNLGSSQSGISDTITYNATDMKQVSSAWADLVASYGFEYAFRPVLSPAGLLYTQLDLGMPELGLQFPASALAYSMPGNLLDYRWTETGSSSANVIFATAQDSSGSGTSWLSDYPHGYDLDDLAAGFPALESPESLTTVTVTGQSQIDAFADGVLPSTTGTQVTPLLILGNDETAIGQARDIVLGSWCQLTLTSPLHPAMSDGSPGYQGQARVIGWTLYPPTANQAESTQIQTWVPVST